MEKELLAHLAHGVAFLVKDCLHSQIIITADGIRLVETKEFHPTSETLLD